MLILSTSVVFSASYGLAYWFEANTDQLHYFVNDVLAVPGYLHNDLIVINIVAGRVYDKEVDKFKYAGERLIARDKIAVYGGSNSASANPYRYYRNFNDFFISPNSAERISRASLPFLLFGLGFLSVLKMKWIRLKNSLDRKKGLIPRARAG